MSFVQFKFLMLQFISKLSCAISPQLLGAGKVMLSDWLQPFCCEGEDRHRERKQSLRKTEVSDEKKPPPIKLEIKLKIIKYQYRSKMLAHFVI